MNETSEPAGKASLPVSDEPECSDGTIRHSWDQQRQQDLDIFGDRILVTMDAPELVPARRDYSFREYHCERCGARKQVSIEVRMAYAKPEAADA